MGQVTSVGLTQYDVEELIASCDGAFSQAEIQALYRRFRTLDRFRKGYISAEEFRAIPELSVNPLCQRVVRMFDNINFRDFVNLLAAFSPTASQEKRIAFIFQVYDVDCDGVVGEEDLTLMVRQLVGSTLTEEQIEYTVQAVLQQAGAMGGDGRRGLVLADFTRVLGPQLLDMAIDNIPAAW